LGRKERVIVLQIGIRRIARISNRLASMKLWNILSVFVNRIALFIPSVLSIKP